MLRARFMWLQSFSSAISQVSSTISRSLKYGRRRGHVVVCIWKRRARLCTLLTTRGGIHVTADAELLRFLKRVRRYGRRQGASGIGSGTVFVVILVPPCYFRYSARVGRLPTSS
jgi:hypothetical protein